MNIELDRPDWAVEPAEAADKCAAFIRATLEAAGRGRNVLLFVSSDEAEAVVAALEEGRKGPLASIEYSWL